MNNCRKEEKDSIVDKEIKNITEKLVTLNDKICNLKSYLSKYSVPSIGKVANIRELLEDEKTVSNFTLKLKDIYSTVFDRITDIDEIMERLDI